MGEGSACQEGVNMIKFAGSPFVDNLSLEAQLIWSHWYLKNTHRWHGLLKEFGHFPIRDRVSCELLCYRKMTGIAVGGMP